jgi:hypothetical protein
MLNREGLAQPGRSHRRSMRPASRLLGPRLSIRFAEHWQGAVDPRLDHSNGHGLIRSRREPDSTRDRDNCIRDGEAIHVTGFGSSDV